MEKVDKGAFYKLLSKITTPGSGYKSIFLSYGALLVYTIILIILLRPEGGFVEFVYDTTSYEKAAELLTMGKLDHERTPVYPGIILLSQLLFGERWATPIVVMHFVLFIISGFILRNMASRYINSNKIVFWITAIYLLNPFLIDLGYKLLTDIPSMALTVIFLSFILRRDVFSFGKKSALCFVLLMLTLIFLRPFFVVFIPLCLLFFVGNLLLFKGRYRKSFIWGLASLGVVVLTVMSYQKAITKAYGIHSITSVSNHNNYFLTRWGMLPNPDFTENVKMKELLQKYRKNNEAYKITQALWEEEAELHELISPKDYEQYVTKTLEFRKWEIPKLLVARWLLFTGESYVFPYKLLEVSKYDTTWPMINITFNQFLILYLLCALLGIIVWYKQRIVPRVFISLWVFTGCIIAGAVVGAQLEWGRISMPAIPAWLIMFGMAANKYSFNKNTLA